MAELQSRAFLLAQEGASGMPLQRVVVVVVVVLDVVVVRVMLVAVTVVLVVVVVTVEVVVIVVVLTVTMVVVVLDVAVVLMVMTVVGQSKYPRLAHVATHTLGKAVSIRPLQSSTKPGNGVPLFAA